MGFCNIVRVGAVHMYCCPRLGRSQREQAARLGASDADITLLSSLGLGCVPASISRAPAAKRRAPRALRRTPREAGSQRRAAAQQPVCASGPGACWPPLRGSAPHITAARDRWGPQPPRSPPGQPPPPPPRAPLCVRAGRFPARSLPCLCSSAAHP